MPPLRLFLWSRAGIWLAALFVLAWFEPKPPPLQARWDDPALHDLGWGTDVWARWDSAWYLRIAEHGYGSREGSAAFYPLYPALVGGLGRVLAGHYVLAGILVSLAACLAAFELLHRLAERRLGAAGASRAVLYLALFPTTIFLQAVYAESLFLALALATFLLAERGRLLEAGVVAGLALPDPAARRRAPAAARAARLARPLAVDARSRRRRSSRSTRSSSGGGWTTRGRSRLAGPLAPHVPGRSAASGTASGGRLAPPTGCTTRRSNAEALAGARPLRRARRRSRGGGSARRTASLPRSSLAIPLSRAELACPLLSLPRFGLVVFPLFLALADARRAAARRRRRGQRGACSGW